MMIIEGAMAEESRLSILMDSLKELVYQYDALIRGYTDREGGAVAGTSCAMLPAEVPASFGMTCLRIPSAMTGQCCSLARDGGEEASVYDSLVVPDGCACASLAGGFGLPVREFQCPTGYGEEAAISLNGSLSGLVSSAAGADLKNIDPLRLRAATEGYNALRRLARGISSVRAQKPGLLYNRDLWMVFEAAAILPPDAVVPLLGDILQALNRGEGEAGPLVPALVYASFITDGSILDELEEGGCLIVEDDTCNGRRQFDLSFNVESPYLYYEILNEFTYRPLCPSVRGPEERFELFYRLLKNHGIELVIFIEDLCCPARKRDIDFLRRGLMRSGVDPLVVQSDSAAEAVRGYVRRM